MNRLLYIVTIVILFVACKDNEEERDFDIHGVWTLEGIYKPDAPDYIYDKTRQAVPLKIFTDSCYYVAQFESTTDISALTPTYSGKYAVVSKGGSDWLYFEDGEMHQLSVIDDSTFMVNDIARSYKWRKMDGSTNANVSDILGVMQKKKDIWDEVNASFVFTETERSLKSENHNLIAIVLCVIIALAFLAYFTRNIYRNKARIEQQLRQIREEIDTRPKAVQEAMKSVKEEFLNSEFYHSLRKRISNGERLKESDWNEIEHNVNSTYPGFTGRLFNLHSMSQAELQTCLLIKLGVPTTEIANTLSKDTSTISTIRSRLFTKVFHSKGSAKEWDEFILSL